MATKALYFDGERSISSRRVPNLREDWHATGDGFLVSRCPSCDRVLQAKPLRARVSRNRGQSIRCVTYRSRPHVPAVHGYLQATCSQRACICGDDPWRYSSMAASQAGNWMCHEFIGVVESIGSHAANREAGRFGRPAICLARRHL
jgi:hypothetical protein